MTKALRNNVVSVFLVAVLICPIVTSIGCASGSKGNQSDSVFSSFSKTKVESKTKKPKKDPNVPVTMSEAMRAPRTM